jgi:hypothetical protein
MRNHVRNVLIVLAGAMAIGTGYAISEHKDDIKELLGKKTDSSHAMVSQLFEKEDFQEETTLWNDYMDSVPAANKEKETRKIPPEIRQDERTKKIKSVVAVPVDLNDDGTDELVVYDGSRSPRLRPEFIYRKYGGKFIIIGDGLDFRIGKKKTKSGFHVLYEHSELKIPGSDNPLVVYYCVRNSDAPLVGYYPKRAIGLAPDEDARKFLRDLAKKAKKSGRHNDYYLQLVEKFRDSFGEVQTARMLIESRHEGVELFDETTYDKEVKQLLGYLADAENPEQYSTDALLFGIAVGIALDEIDPLKLRKGLPPFEVVFPERDEQYQYIETPGGRVKIWTSRQPWGYRQDPGGGTTYEPKPMHYDVADQYERFMGSKPSNAEMSEMEKWGASYTMQEPNRNK